MFENDSIQSFQRTPAQRTKVKGVTSAVKQSKDDFIMDTNNSSIVSKRSVEKLYWSGEPEYFRHFVSKFKRRSPLINRGYWLRMRAVESVVERFLAEPTEKHKLVINLGCGYDPLPWLFLGKQAHLCSNTTFIDVDYPPLMRKKVEVIQKTSQLSDLIPALEATTSKDGLLCRGSNYAAIGCDLRNLDFLHFVLTNQMAIETCSVAILFVAEVSTAYMDLDGSQAVMEWAASYEDVRFCLLEQHLPDGSNHPFAQTMLKHFDKLRTPLTAVGTIDDMHNRFVKAGWAQDQVYIKTLWEVWADDSIVSAQARQELDAIEPFDEWEELALFGAHYFLLVARKSSTPWTEVYWPASRGRRKLASTPSLNCQPFKGSHRRFGAIITGDGCAGVHAGLGTKERLTDTACYATEAGKQRIEGPALLDGLMCHTITPLADQTSSILVGGRTSPANPSKKCYLLKEGRWSDIKPLPYGLYRHSAISVDHPATGPCLLAFGGKTSDRDISNAVLSWRPNHGWSRMNATAGMPPARFGALVVVDAAGLTGSWFGGIGVDGTILQDCWEWEIIANNEIRFTQRPDFAADHPTLCRFGAQVSERTAGTSQLIFGGVCHGPMLTREEEIFDWNASCSREITGPRPLLVGMSVQGRVCFGGGATCFSFGTHWNDCVVLQEADEVLETWSLLQSQSPSLIQTTQPVAKRNSNVEVGENTTVRKLVVNSEEDFKQIIAAREPVIIQQADIGECVTRWTPSYLRNKIGTDRLVSVHAASQSKMDFQTKNFTYIKQKFGDFIDNVEKGELLYLRALSAESPSEQPTSLQQDFPAIAADFHLPAELKMVSDNMHSSPLRISSRVTMWLHYDVMANVLCQVRGRKQMTLFPPSDVVCLGFEAGASSSSIDVLNPDEQTRATLRHCHAHTAALEAGDLLFIPPLWLHTAAPSDDISVAVNVFFRDLESGYAAGRDVYGNRDVAAYEKGRREVSKLAKSFAALPPDMADFYLARLAAELASQVNRI